MTGDRAVVTGIHQLHFLPWLRYWEKVQSSDVFVVLDNIQFNRNGWQNRNKIKTASGVCLLTVPVLHKNAQRLDEVRINNRTDWRKKHWRTIEQNYCKAPFFAEYGPFLSETYSREWEFLNDLNQHMFKHFLEALGITTRIAYASELRAPGKATERLAQVIRAVGGTVYYTGAYALDAYLDAQLLADAGIGLELQQWKAPVYPQSHGPFVEDLAIIDLLMNCGPDSLETIMGQA